MGIMKLSRERTNIYVAAGHQQMEFIGLERILGTDILLRERICGQLYE